MKPVLGCSTFSTDDNIETAEAGSLKLIIYKGQALGIYLADDKPFLTVRGILKFSPIRSWVTVDMGAVGYLVNGADVMSPGIVDVEENVTEGDAVWVRDVNNLKPLAVGIAILSKEKMMTSNKGKAIKTLHYVGDKIWNVGE